MNKIEFGDCREIMKRWIDEGVKIQTCITSPPYYGLRDYGVDGQIGLEQSVDDYVNNMVEVFRLVKDILSDDGTLWLNLGDTYSDTRWSSGGGQIMNKNKDEHRSLQHQKNTGLPSKNLIGIPWKVAFALQADGWILRQDIIWQKPNPMPESVRDRCTKSHEYIFLLSKSPQYYFDHLAIKEPAVSGKDLGLLRSVSHTDGSKVTWHSPSIQKRKESGIDSKNAGDGMRNKRDVWSVNVRPYKGAHFATYPTALIEPCILAGSRKNDIVFDPFMGSGTTAQVALQHGRQYLGCELNKEYEKLQQERINNG